MWTGAPAAAAELTALRMRLRSYLSDGFGPPGASEDDVARLLLVFEELTSNGLRHGLPPVQVTVSSVGSGWVLEVSDASADHLPQPAVDRDPATGGLGLYLVARLSAEHGWSRRGGRKSVWARIEHASAGAAAEGAMPDRSERGRPNFPPPGGRADRPVPVDSDGRPSAAESDVAVPVRRL